ncbi:MAG: GIY-YIG nuclease family protein [Candidatus Paceibacterota bacterium]|jgi:putative endonuclease
MYFIYAIYNQKNNKIYVGQTKNLQERLDLHNKKFFSNSYTSRYEGKWILIYSEKVTSRKNALIREKQLKSFRGRMFIKKYIPR